ncbi:hypothetical protein V7Z92_28130, partial [Priestia megaterium]|uniref:hypothetical protein n=1 Tax=Priestia megaterium TaxID=1404 RepID=UPI00300B5AD1
NAIEEEIYIKLEWIRKKGNKAAHDMKEVEVVDVLQTHKFLFEISVWYMQVYVTYKFEAPVYKLPVTSESNSSKSKDKDDLIKLYLDKKIDDMWVEIQRQLDDLRVEKEKEQEEVTNISKSEVSSSKEAIQSVSKVHLQFKNQKLFIPSELADMPINNLPVNGCNYLLAEFSRVGITSLRKIKESMDHLHMRLNGIGIYTIEKFWEQINSIESTVLINTRVNSNTGVKTITISEEVHRIFVKNKFNVTNKTKKAVEFEHTINKEIVYLLPNKLTTIVLHPDTAKKNFEMLDKPNHSTALSRFPKAIKNGKTQTNFGYSFKFEREEELDGFLNKLNDNNA